MANTGRRYTHEQIIGILPKEAEAAKSAAESIRRREISAHRLRRWRAKFAVAEIRLLHAGILKRYGCVLRRATRAWHISS
jgi:hypothetical protein